MQITLDKPSFLVGAGYTNREDFERIYELGSPLVAVDGGANFLRAWGYEPQLLIGDMDSIEDLEFFRQSTTEVLHIPDQDSTDLEKCLLKVKAPLYLAFGFWGSRFDHSLEILHVLQKYEQQNIVFFSEDDVIFKVPVQWQVSLPMKTRVSLYPLKQTQLISSRGLKYGLDGLEMKQGFQIGTSNEVSDSNVFVEQKEAGLLGIVPKNFYKEILNSLDFNF